MPTYEYECGRCGHTFEKFHGISATPPKRCPECRGKLKRNISTGAGLLFKGTGFYITDYRSEGYKKASKAEKSSNDSASSSSSTSAKSESKTATSK